MSKKQKTENFFSFNCINNADSLWNRISQLSIKPKKKAPSSFVVRNQDQVDDEPDILKLSDVYRDILSQKEDEDDS